MVFLFACKKYYKTRLSFPGGGGITATKVLPWSIFPVLRGNFKVSDHKTF